MPPGGRGQKRTFVSTTEPMDAVYRPASPVAARYASYFRPTMLTDENGQIASELSADLLRPDTPRVIQTAPLQTDAISARERRTTSYP